MQDDPYTIDLWSFSLNCNRELLSRAESLLTAEEKEKLARFHFGWHGRRFIVRRSIRRVLLARLIGEDPADIHIVMADHEKPHLAGIDSALEFNSSHSGDRAIIVTGIPVLGVDIESLDRPIDYLRFAEHSFSKEEYDDVRRCNDDDRPTVFFNCWTGKEAYLKAIGRGLSKSLRSFSVRCAVDEPPGLRWDVDRPDTLVMPRFFRCCDAGFVVTVVAETPSDSLQISLHELSTFSLCSDELVELTEPAWQKA